MKFTCTLFRRLSLYVFLLLFVTGNIANAQILSYTTNTSGALNSVAANTTGTRVAFVNGSKAPGSSCGTGFSSAGYAVTTTYSSSLAGLQVSVTPNTGYILNVTGFSADLRRSASGPASIRFAYSTNGTTWIDQGTDQSPDNASCGTTTTGVWTTSFTVTASNKLLLTLYGFNASSTAGTLQLLNLLVNGTVTAIPTCGVPSGLSATTVTTTSATLNWTAVSGAVSYNIEYRKVGTTTWSTTTSTTNSKGISGLTASTSYEFQVQTVCSGSATSAYSASTSFTTTAVQTAGSGKILVYFNQPVDTTVSTGVRAKYLNKCMADTLIAYINRAKYSIDIAQYEYSQTSSYSNIATAVNNAYARGVVVRWIYCTSGTNTGLSALNSGIHTLASPAAGTISPCGKAYSIMHNKFVNIDANSTNPADAMLWTGSPDWNVTQFNYDFNNVVIVQDSSLAHAYTKQFNLMWGSTTATPNSSASLWGPCKPNSGQHIFTVAGKEVELYFTPSDSTNSHILSTIKTANTDLYFGMYTFTSVPDANQVVTEYSTNGVTVDGIVDEYSTSYSAYTTLNSGLGTTHLKVYNGGSYIYHNKYLIVDPSNTCSDPLVLTGSHNWTASADLENDENTLIIHNDTIANLYYQAFKADFASLTGMLSHISVAGGCGTVYSSTQSHVISNVNDTKVTLYPNPTRSSFMIQYGINEPQNVTIGVYNVVGQLVTTLADNERQETGTHQYTFTPALQGIYITRITIGNNTYTQKAVKIK